LGLKEGQLIRCLLLVAALCSTASAASLAADPVASASSDDEQAVLKVDSDWADAEMRRDGTALEQIMDNRFIATFGEAKPVDKPAFIKSILSEDPAKRVTQELSNRSVIVSGDTAVVVETDTETTVKDAEKKVLFWRFTVTYIKRQGRWIALAEQGGPARP
jgi:hypothetical protein